MNRAGGSEVYSVGVMGSQSHRSSRGSDTSSAYSGSDTMHSVRSSDQVSIALPPSPLSLPSLPPLPIPHSNPSVCLLDPHAGIDSLGIGFGLGLMDFIPVDVAATDSFHNPIAIEFQSDGQQKSQNTEKRRKKEEKRILMLNMATMEMIFNSKRSKIKERQRERERK